MTIALWIVGIVSAWCAIVGYAIIGRGMYWLALNYSYNATERLSWWYGFFWPVTTVFVLIVWVCFGVFYIPWCFGVDAIGNFLMGAWDIYEERKIK